MKLDSSHQDFWSTIDEAGGGSHESVQDEPRAAFPGGQQPIIGIPIPVQQGSQGPLFLSDAVGAWAVERMLGRVFLIPLWPFPTHPQMYQSLWSVIQSMDGLLLPAGLQGTDWYAQWKEAEQQPGPKTWSLAWEIALAQLATYLGMPLLAIGEGAEKWNVALGGRGMERMVEPAPSTPPDAWERFAIRIRAQSKLAAYLQPALVEQEGGQKPWELAFLPQQGVEKLAPELRPCAQAEESTVVAFERRDTAFGLGMLGRLDWGLDQSYSMTLFEAFLQACRSFDQTRQQQHGWESSRDTICTTVYDRVTHGQSLLSLSRDVQEEKPQRSRPLSGPLVAPMSPANESREPQRRPRQRSQVPTKTELNEIRRKRLKAAAR